MPHDNPTHTSSSTIRNFIAGLALVTLAVGCAAEPDAAPDDTDEIVANLLEAGYPAGEIAITDGDVLMVGGDAVVTLQASREMLGLGSKRDGSHDADKHYRTNNTVDASIETICVNGAAFTGTLSTALDSAIGNYNALGLRFDLVRTAGSTAGCDAVITANVVSGTGGFAGFPAYGQPTAR